MEQLIGDPTGLGRAELAAHRAAVDVAEIEARFAAAAALARELEMRPLLAHCRLGLGRAYARAGMNARAPAGIKAALAEYHAMDMPYWREHAERALG